MFRIAPFVFLLACAPARGPEGSGCAADAECVKPLACAGGVCTRTSEARLVLSPVKRECLPLDPQTDLYGRILFHEGRFRRLRSYQLLKARECVAEIASDGATIWFGPYLPTEFVLGDPAARDARPQPSHAGAVRSVGCSRR